MRERVGKRGCKMISRAIKPKRVNGRDRFRKLTNRTFYYALKLPRMLFGRPFWLVRQKMSRLEDEWDNEGWGR